MTAAAIKSDGQSGLDKVELKKLPKSKLIAIILKQREQLTKLQEDIDKEKAAQKIEDINKHVNQPTSKKPE